jgi:hypothetical protein
MDQAYPIKKLSAQIYVLESLRILWSLSSSKESPTIIEFEDLLQTLKQPANVTLPEIDAFQTLILVVPNGNFLSCVQNRMLCVFIFSRMRAVCSAHLAILHLTNLFGETCKC